MALCLDKALFQLKVSTVESRSQVISFEDYGVVGNIVVEIYKFVIILQVERVLNEISFVTLELYVRNFHVINKTNDLIEDLILSLTESTQVNRCMDSCGP
jgi:hypothetical protein